MSHIDPDDLLRYRFDPTLLDDPEAVASHVRSCDTCATTLAEIDEQERALHDGETWSAAAAMRSPSGRFLKASERRKQMERENMVARRLLEPLLQPSLRLAEANLSAKAAFLNAGTVRVLCEIARGFHERKPISALEMATVAYQVAQMLPDDASTPRRLSMAYAQRERANALRYLGRFRDALAALDDAEPLFDRDPALDPFEIGVVNLIRATVLMDKGDLEEAATLAITARTQFREYSDSSRELTALLVNAYCFLQLGRARQAADACEAVATIARREGNVSMLARGLANAGVAYRHMGDFYRAEQRTFEAIPLFDELHLATEVARANLQLATIAVERGDLQAGIALLERSEAELSTLGITNDAAAATLRWAEACLALGARAGVAEKCRRLVIVFESEGMHRRARVALAYLQEALDSQTATPALVAEVRQFIETLPRHPDRAFTPSGRPTSPPS